MEKILKSDRLVLLHFYSVPSAFRLICYVMVFSFNDSTIGVVRLDKASNELLSKLKHIDWYDQEIKLMKEIRKQEWLAVRVLLKKLLGNERKILYTKKGKPYFFDDDYQIGISHTKGYAAVILRKQKTVSIDIQLITSRVESIKTRFVNRIEENNISIKAPLIHLLLHWSAKEALYKILDQEYIDFKTQLHIHHFEPVIKKLGNFVAHETKTKQYHSFIVKYWVQDDYVICWID